MPNNWKVIFYETEVEECPFGEYLDSLRIKQQAKLYSWLDLLEKQGPNLPRPYADFLTDEIHELRVKISGDQVRALYFFCYRDFIVVTHAFIKTTSKVPKKEIRRAKKISIRFFVSILCEEITGGI